MRPPPLRLPHRRSPRQDWAPMTDAEWERLAGLLAPRPRPGRPAADLRRRWDAIFWIACASGPWRELPAGLGRADTAHRALRRAARSGLINRLLIAVSDYPVLGGFEALRWRISRACRRVARLLTTAQLLMAERLGLADALPCPPCRLPRPDLSETLILLGGQISKVGDLGTLMRLMRGLHRRFAGDRRCWTLTD